MSCRATTYVITCKAASQQHIDTYRLDDGPDQVDQADLSVERRIMGDGVLLVKIDGHCLAAKLCSSLGCRSLFLLAEAIT
jgi:hypothetical protein